MDPKETKELLVGVNELALALVAVIKQGGGLIKDFEGLYAKYVSDADFKTKIDAAVAGVAAVPGELKALDVVGTLELAKTQLDYVPKILAAVGA